MSPKIKIIIEKGPREGETLEYDPTSVIKIGRVARGNTIAIKDAGISSKHLCIQFDKQLQKWTLIDVDSSNGTILNGIDLKPNESYSLSDGDCIKIGDLTSMIVKIGSEIEDVGPSDRRNTRRNGKRVAVVESELGFNEGKVVGELPQKRNLRGRGRKVAAAVVVEEESEKAVEVEVVQKRVLRGRGKQGVDMESEKAVVEEDLQKRDLRGRSKKSVDVVSEKAVVEEDLQKRDLRGRSKKSVDVVSEKAVVEEDLQKRDLRGRSKKSVDVVSEKAVVEEDVQKRDLRGRGKKSVEVESEKSVVEQDVQKRDLRGRGKKSVDVKIGVENLSCKRVLRSSKKGENVNVDVREMGEDVSVLTESKKTRGGRKKLPVKVVEDSDLDGGKLVENGVSVEVKRTGRGRGRPRKMMKVESLEENYAKESVQVSEGNEGGDFDKGKSDLLEKVENMGSVGNLDANTEVVQDHLVDKLDTNNECVQDDLAEKLALMQDDCEEKETAAMNKRLKMIENGIPNTTRKYKEETLVKPSTWETIFERAMKSGAAKPSS